MEIFLKEEINARGTLTEDKGHTLLLLLLEPLQAWWGCPFGWRWCLQHQCCLGAGKELRGELCSAAWLSPEETAVGWVQREGWQDRTRSCEGLMSSSWVSCWLTAAGSLKGFCSGLGVCWTWVPTSTRSHCRRFDQTDFLGVSAQGKAERQGGWENVLG